MKESIPRKEKLLGMMGTIEQYVAGLIALLAVVAGVFVGIKKLKEESKSGKEVLGTHMGCVAKELCEEKHRHINEKLENLQESIDEVRDELKAMSNGNWAAKIAEKVVEHISRKK